MIICCLTNAVSIAVTGQLWQTVTGTYCRQFECPTHQGEIYKLPTAVQEQVNMLYQRDIARMAGEGKDTKGMEDEYKTFLAELGGKDSRDMGGSG